MNMKELINKSINEVKEEEGHYEMLKNHGVETKKAKRIAFQGLPF